jgi:hypothetical protein
MKWRTFIDLKQLHTVIFSTIFRQYLISALFIDNVVPVLQFLNVCFTLTVKFIYPSTAIFSWVQAREAPELCFPVALRPRPLTHTIPEVKLDVFLSQ